MLLLGKCVRIMPHRRRKKVIDFGKKNKFTDDQKGLFAWIINNNNCHKCYFDYHLDFVFNYLYGSLNVQYINDKIKVSDDSYPCVFHFPMQPGDLGKRSEKVRNWILPRRPKVKQIEYFKEFYTKLCSSQCCYIGYYWWCFVLLIIILLILWFNK